MKSLNEFRVGTVHKSITIDVDIEATRHALERQSRHGRLNLIELDEVGYIVDKAIPELIKMLIRDEVDISKDRVILQDDYTETTVVGILEPKGREEFKFVVITLYRGKDFKTARGQRIIKV